MRFTDYNPFASHNWRGWVHASRPDLPAGDPLAWLEAQPRTAVHERPTACTYRVEKDGRPVAFVKHVTGLRDHDPHNRSLLRRFRWRLRRARVFRVLRISVRMQRAGVGVPRVLLAAKQTQGWAAQELLITEAVPARTVYQHLLACNSADERRTLLAKVGRWMAAFHDAGFIHGDLALGNVLVDDAHANWWVIDNERTRRWPIGPPAQRRRRNLIQAVFRTLLVFPWSDARQLLFHYYEQRGGDARWKRRQRLLVLRGVRRRFRARCRSVERQRFISQDIADEADSPRARFIADARQVVKSQS